MSGQTSTHVKIVAILAARPGKEEALKALLFGILDSCRADAGNLRWDIWQDHADPGRFVLDEVYVDQAAIAAHRETPHFKEYASQINELAERTVMVLDPVDIA